MFPPLVLLLLLPWMASAACRPSETGCPVDDCGDDCSYCNSTLLASAKKPLRLSAPRRRPFVCSVTLAAKRPGDRLQVTFLSFQVGALQVDNDSVAAACPSGHLRLSEPAASPASLSQQTRGFTQLLSALKRPPEQLAARFDAARGSPHFGAFCGDMVGGSATFYSAGGNVTLQTVVPEAPPFSFSVYLTYRALPPPEEDDRHHLGSPVRNTYCDRLLANCDRKRCAIRTPNFPGFYLRNITCHYWIRQEQVPHGRHASIVLSQSSEYKISLYTGRSSPLSRPRDALTDECHGDVLRIFDGPTTAAPLLVQLCGAGALAEVVSSGPEVLVQLHSAPSQAMHASFAELQVGVRFADAAEPRAPGGRCDFEVDGGARRSGLLRSPPHTLPRNTTCTFRLQGAGPRDRVWITFLSYFVADRHPWSRRETCEVGSLEVAEAERSPLRFCEKTLPRVCARAADAPRHVPPRPCLPPAESYLSRGSALVLRHTAAAAPELPSWSSSFVLRYEFVDARPSCGGRVEGGDAARVGTLSSPRDVFLFGRGGSPNVSCSYELVGAPGERLLLTFTEVRLHGSSCAPLYDPVAQRHACSDSSAAARVTVWERAPGGAPWSPLACFCGMRNDPRRPLLVESVTGRVRVDFEVRGMTPLDDFEDFGFEAVFEFLPASLCQADVRRSNSSSSGGEVVFRVPPSVEGRAMPLRCRWLLEAAPHKYLYLRLQGTDAGAACPSGNKVLVYPSPPSSATPLSAVCLEGGHRRAASVASSSSSSRGAGRVDVFSDHWHNGTSVLRDHLYVEVLASHAQTVHFGWIEVSRGAPDCEHACPELGACLAPELWCDGHAHCPSGEDEAHCAPRLPLQPLLAAAGAASLLLLLVVMVAVAARLRRRSTDDGLKGPHPSHPEEDFPMDLCDGTL